METLVANLTGNLRRATLQGREYIVAPLSLIVPGVLNGSQGPLLYAEDELARNVDAWNGVPIVVDHPYVNGRPVSARTPEVLDKSAVGLVMHAKANGKLTAEGWFDVENLRKVDSRILTALQSSHKIELSTGLNLDVKEEQSAFNGRQYIGRAYNYRPDHLAVFVDKVGACSVNDGCGVNVNEQHSNLSGDPTVDKKQTIDSIIANCECWTENDRKTLEGLPDDKLKGINDTALNSKKLSEQVTANEKKLKEMEPVVNAAKKGFKAGNDEWTLNDKGEWVKQTKEGKTVANQEGTTDNQTPPGKPMTDEEKEEMRKKMAANLKLEDLPPEIQEDVQFARNAKQQRKEKLLDQLTANIECKDERKKHRERLGKRTLNELEQDVALLPKEPISNQDDSADYFGASVPISNQRTTKPTPLGLPVWNFDPEPAQRSA